MHISYDTAAPPPEVSILQQSELGSASAALDKVQGGSCGSCPLKLEHQAARQVGAALACRRATEFIEAGCIKLYPGFRQALLLLDQGRAMKKRPVADRRMPLLQTITHVLLGHVAGQRLPSAQEQTALCSFLHLLDQGNRTTLHLTDNDPFMVLAQQQDSDHHSLLYLAVSKGMTGLVEWLMNTQPASFPASAPFTGKHDENDNPLLLAVEKGDERMARLLLEKRADINCRDRLGQTPLHRAVETDNKSMLSFLLNRGANVNRVDGLRGTPLHCAIYDGNGEMVRLLLDNRADINLRASLGQPPLHWAIAKGNVSLVALLVGRGADVNALDAFGQGPLLWAIAKDYEGIIRLLLENNADVNYGQASGETVLHKAVERGNERVIRLVLDKNADINALDNLGRSPLSLALSEGDETIVQLLLGRGASHAPERTSTRWP